MSKFRRLSITHAAMMGGDAAMIVALANSLFFNIDPSAARGRVLLFLIVSFAPFLLVAPLIGPVIDRAAGGRRTVIQAVAGGPGRAPLLMAAIDHSLRCSRWCSPRSSCRRPTSCRSRRSCRRSCAASASSSRPTRSSA